jgi:hypothetical protein
MLEGLCRDGVGKPLHVIAAYGVWWVPKLSAFEAAAVGHST